MKSFVKNREVRLFCQDHVGHLGLMVLHGGKLDHQRGVLIQLQDRHCACPQ